MQKYNISDNLANISGISGYLLLKININQVKMMSKFDLSVEDVRYIPMYEEYLSLRQERLKTTHIIAHLAEKYFVSEAYLQKQFKKYVGSSPSNYLKQLRIEKSKQLLRTTNRSIAEIAEMVGFQDTSYYISVFKAIEAITPLTYKKMWSYGSISSEVVRIPQ